jgi:predicted nucleic acid-binding protein
MNATQITSAIVIDANTAIHQIVDNPLAEHLVALWIGWVKAGCKIYAPQLWLNEVTSTIHKLFALKVISEPMAQEALERVLNLGVICIEQDSTLCRMAFDLATRLGQTAAYDSFYLALAIQLGADFWTGDKTLIRQAQQIGLSGIHWIGE